VEVQQLLVSLLTQRATSDQDLSKIVLNEAVRAVSRVTPEQCNALSLQFDVRYVRHPSIVDVETLSQHMGKIWIPLVGDPDKGHSHREHLIYAGCLSNKTFSEALPSVLADIYPQVALQAIRREELLRLLESREDQLELLIASHLRQNPDGTFALVAKVGAESQLERDDTKEMIRRLEAKGRADFFGHWRNLPNAELLDLYWRSYAGPTMLTSVGVAIARSNLQCRGLLTGTLDESFG